MNIKNGENDGIIKEYNNESNLIFEGEYSNRLKGKVKEYDY